MTLTVFDEYTGSTGKYSCGNSLTTEVIWKHWIRQQPQTYTITAYNHDPNQIWNYWIMKQREQSSSTLVYSVFDETPIIQTVPRQPVREVRGVLSKEQLLERSRQAKVIRDEADQRANALLLSFLNDRQRADFEQSRYFEVLAADGARRYRIKEGWAGNIEVLNPAGQVIEKLCIHPQKEMPKADNLLSQKLMLEADEELFRSTANIVKVAV